MRNIRPSTNLVKYENLVYQQKLLIKKVFFDVTVYHEVIMENLKDYRRLENLPHNFFVKWVVRCNSSMT